jgi:hypothetical protein
MTQQLVSPHTADREEFQRRLERTRGLWMALHAFFWLALVSARLFPRTMAGVFVLGVPVLAGGAWIYAIRRLGCPRCGRWHWWSYRCACCARCGLPAGDARPQTVSGSILQREQRWATLTRRRQLWKEIFPPYLLALALLQTIALKTAEQFAVPATLALIVGVAGAVLIRFLLLRCPDCNRPLASASQQYCASCGTCLSDRSASRRQFDD